MAFASLFLRGSLVVGTILLISDLCDSHHVIGKDGTKVFTEDDLYLVRARDGKFVLLEQDKTKPLKHLKRAEGFINPILTKKAVHWYGSILNAHQDGLHLPKLAKVKE